LGGKARTESGGFLRKREGSFGVGELVSAQSPRVASDKIQEGKIQGSTIQSSELDIWFDWE